jgi:NDP-sugar pyrophosphorylase family protein
MFRPDDLFDLSQTAHAALFEGCEHAWEALKRLKDYLAAHLEPGLRNQCDGVAWIGKQVFIGEGTTVEDGVMIKGPAIIGRNCEIRHGAYLRENVIVGDACVVGNACELKNAILFNEADVPHFNYVGDSILGHAAHLGAGVKISNLKVTPGSVTVNVEGKPLDTGLRKLGALIGDHANVGCNAVLNPGTILGRNSVIYPNVNWRGILPANMIVKNKAALDIVVRRPRTS